jgi:hypothetical protein
MEPQKLVPFRYLQVPLMGRKGLWLMLPSLRHAVDLVCSLWLLGRKD